MLRQTAADGFPGQHQYFLYCTTIEERLPQHTFYSDLVFSAVKKTDSSLCRYANSDTSSQHCYLGDMKTLRMTTSSPDIG